MVSTDTIARRRPFSNVTTGPPYHEHAAKGNRHRSSTIHRDHRSRLRRDADLHRRARSQAQTTRIEVGRSSRRSRLGTNKSFAPLKQIDAGVLNVGYAEVGPATGPPVILLHGWPYDIHSFVDVAPALARAGYRVIVPYVRGYGTTRFLR
jgi:predicted dienelactone hydrolase